jgi:adenylosuccinate synthase
VSGLALKRRNIKEVIGVVKACTTRVGSGPFPTEDHGEVGVSTGRTRRRGWLVLLVLKYSCAINDYDSLNLSKIDVLGTFDKIIAVAYKDPQTGQRMQSFPADTTLLDCVAVVFDEVPGWKTGRRALPRRASDQASQRRRATMSYIEKIVGCKVKWIGTSPDRNDMIIR